VIPQEARTPTLPQPAQGDGSGRSTPLHEHEPRQLREQRRQAHRINSGFTDMKKHCAAAMAGRRGHGRCLRRPLSVAAGPLPRHARAGVQTRWPRGGARHAQQPTVGCLRRSAVLTTGRKASVRTTGRKASVRGSGAHLATDGGTLAAPPRPCSTGQTGGSGTKLPFWALCISTSSSEIGLCGVTHEYMFQKPLSLFFSVMKGRVFDTAEASR